MKKTGLYIHFPFCRRSCFYCHFYKTRFQEAKAAAYLQLLGHEIRLRRDPDLLLDSVYLGGGSPSLLTAAQLSAVMTAVTKNFRLAENAEVTLEANPEDLSAAQLAEFRRAGVNRLSIGVQSFQERDLVFLKRNHSAAQGVHAVEMALAAGFTNCSLDLIIGLETQTPRSMNMNFRMIERLKPAHVSVYILEGVARPENDEQDSRLYFLARRNLLDLGYVHYEVSNYCRPGKTSRHNLKYWQMAPYIGLGPSAAGFLNGRDYLNHPGLKKYRLALKNEDRPEQKTRPLQPAQRGVITGLRLLEGIPAASFRSFSAATAFLLQEGLLIRKGENIAVAPEKILLLNEILAYFI